MSILDRIQDSFKYLDKNGLKKVLTLVKNHDRHWTGTHAEYEAVKDTLPDYTILHFTDDYEDSVGVVDKIEDNNMNGVTSNAVYDALVNVKTITPAPVTGGAGGTISWGSFDVKKLGKIVNITINNMSHSQDVSSSGGVVVATGLPKPVLGRVYLVGINYGDEGNNASAYIDGNGNLGIDGGFLLATSRLYGSCCYISV